MKKLKNTWVTGSIMALVTTIITIILWILAKYILSLNLSFFNPLEEAFDNYQLTDLYFNLHRSDAAVQDAACSDILVLDISRCRTRSEIASLFSRVADAEPRMVALDVIFGPASSVSQTENDSLLGALRRLPNPVIAKNMVAQDDTSFIAERSFFADEQWTTEGVVNFEYGVVRHFEPLQVFAGDTMASFTKCIADQAGISMPPKTDNYLIDYTLARGMTLDATDQWDDSYLKDKIIIIGDLNDYRDQFVVPVTLKGETRIAGVDIHRQILATVAASHIFRKVPAWLEILISIILIFGATMLSYVIRIRSKQNQKMSSVAISWLMNLMQLGFIILAIVIAYCLFWGCHILFSVKYIIVGFALIELIGKIVRDIKKWIPIFGNDEN